MNLVELRSSLKGVIIPVTTPFKENSEVDYDALKKLMEFYLKNNIRCFIAAGSTGQCSALEKNEHRRIIMTIVDMCSE